VEDNLNYTLLSTFGLTRDLYSVIIVWESLFVKDLLIMPRFLFASLTAFAHWWLNFKLLSTKTLRSHSSLTDSSLISDIHNFHCYCLSAVIQIERQSIDHWYIAFKSVISCSTLSWIFTFAKTFISLANFSRRLIILLSMLFRYKLKNNNGPKIDLSTWLNVDDTTFNISLLLSIF